MPQEVIDCVNQLGKADTQPELLTFYDRRGRLIGDSVTPGVPDIPDPINPEPNGTEDLELPIVNLDYGINEDNDYDQPPIDIPQTYNEEPQDDTLPQDDPYDSHQQVEPPPTTTEVTDQEPIPLRRSTRLPPKPQRLIPTFSKQSYHSTAATTVRLVHPDEHMDQNYVLVAHYIMAQYSLKTGMKLFKERGTEAITQELSQLHF